MKEYAFGICLLLAIVGFQLAARHLRHRRLRRWWERADEACRNHDYDAAEQALVKCVAVMPLWVPARTLLGIVHANQGKIAEAEEHLKMASALQPRKPDGFVQLGLFYAAHFPDRADDAIDAVAKAIEYDPELSTALAADPRLEGLRQYPRFRAMFE